LFILALDKFRGVAEGGSFDGLVAVFLQGLNMGGEAAEHVHDLGIFFGFGGESLGSVRLEQCVRELGGGELLDVIAVVNAVMAKGVAEAPEFLDDVRYDSQPRIRKGRERS